jgi:hypothetical protein
LFRNSNEQLISIRKRCTFASAKCHRRAQPHHAVGTSNELPTGSSGIHAFLKVTIVLLLYHRLPTIVADETTGLPHEPERTHRARQHTGTIEVTKKWLFLYRFYRFSFLSVATACISSIRQWCFTRYCTLTCSLSLVLSHSFIQSIITIGSYSLVFSYIIVFWVVAVPCRSNIPFFNITRKTGRLPVLRPTAGNRPRLVHSWMSSRCIRNRPIGGRSWWFARVD